MGLVAPPAVRAQTGRGPAGRWAGRVALPGAPLEVRIDLEHTESGWVGGIVIPSESVRRMALKGVDVSGRHVSFAVDERGGPTFDGVLEKGGTRMEGTFRASGFEYPFRLARAGGKPG